MRGMRRILSRKEAERKVQIEVNVEQEQASNDFVRLRWLVIVGRRRQRLSPSVTLACDMGDGNWNLSDWRHRPGLTKYLWSPRLFSIDHSLELYYNRLQEVLQNAL